MRRESLLAWNFKIARPIVIQCILSQSVSVVAAGSSSQNRLRCKGAGWAETLMLLEKLATQLCQSDGFGNSYLSWSYKVHRA